MLLFPQPAEASLELSNLKDTLRGEWLLVEIHCGTRMTTDRRIIPATSIAVTNFKTAGQGCFSDSDSC
jgi:hypothetical protein